MKMRFMTAVWLSLVLLATGLTAAWTDDPNASIVQGSAIGTPLPVTGAVTSTVNGTVTSNQGTAGASPWLVDVNNWLPYPWQITFNGVAQPVTAAQSGSWTVGISGTPIVLSSQSGVWTVGVNNFPSSFGVTQGTNPWTISGTVTTNQGTSPWLIGGTLTTNVGPPGANNLGTLSATANASAPTFTEGNQVALSTDLSGNLRVVTTGGNTVTQGTSPWIVGFNGVAQPVTVGNFPVTQTVAGTVTANAGSGTFTVDGSGHTQPVSGTVAATQSGTWTVQPGNTANTTAWKVDGSAVTQPVSGTFWQATQPISGTVTANAGSGTFTVGGTVTANAGTGTFTTAGEKTNNNAAPGATNVGTLGAVANAAAPTLTEGNLVALSSDLSGRLRTDTSTVGGTAVDVNSGAKSNGTQRVVLATDQPTNTNPLNVQGTLTNNSAAPSTNNIGVLNAVANAAAPTRTEGNQGTLSTDLLGYLRVVDNHPNVVVTGSFTRSANTTTYTALAYLSNSASAPTILSIPGCARVNGGSGRIVSMSIIDEANQTTKASLIIYAFDAAVTAHNDDAAMATSNTDAEHYVCSWSTVSRVLNTGSGVSGNVLLIGALDPNTATVPAGSGVQFTCAAGSTSLYFIFEMVNAYVPISGEKFVIRLGIIQD